MSASTVDLTLTFGSNARRVALLIIDGIVYRGSRDNSVTFHRTSDGSLATEIAGHSTGADNAIQLDAVVLGPSGRRSTLKLAASWGEKDKSGSFRADYEGKIAFFEKRELKLEG